MSAEGLLDELEAVLLHIGVLLPTDKSVWDANELVRLSIERLWIVAGTTAEEYRKAVGFDKGARPWAELYRHRNLLAHQTLSERTPDRTWHESLRDLPRLLDQVRAARP